MGGGREGDEMMLSFTSTPPTFSLSCLPPPILLSRRKHNLLLSPSILSLRKPTSACSFITCLRIGVQELAEITQNKVLVAAAVSAAIGQLSKPFTSAFLYGKDVDFKAFVRSGGFPSTHSASVVAAATSLGLERGLSDSIFGMSVVFASIVMYDAQGVRREVGNQAKVLNWILRLKTQNNSNTYRNNENLIDSKSYKNSESLTPLLSKSGKAEKEMNRTPKERKYSPLHFRSENSRERSSSMPPSFENQDYNSFTPLKESVGHTEIEVVAGALLGFLVGLAVHSVL